MLSHDLWSNWLYASSWWAPFILYFYLINFPIHFSSSLVFSCNSILCSNSMHSLCRRLNSLQISVMGIPIKKWSSKENLFVANLNTMRRRANFSDGNWIPGQVVSFYDELATCKKKDFHYISRLNIDFRKKTIYNWELFTYNLFTLPFVCIMNMSPTLTWHVC